MSLALTKTKRLGQVHIDLGSHLKKDAERVLREMNLSVSDAVRIFLREVVLTREIPFDVRFTTNIPNEETRAAIAEVESGQTQKITRETLKTLWDEA